MKILTPVLILILFCLNVSAQDKKTDTIPLPVPVVIDPADTVLRIININPYFTIHVDSILNYELRINKDPLNYNWYLKQAPVGVKIDRNGTLYFKADKSFFRSGKLKYDEPYKVSLGVQNMYEPEERVDTSITILFYSTEIAQSTVKTGVLGTVYNEEGDTVRFRIQCETGSFPIEQINFNSNIPISVEKSITKCNDEFVWAIPFDFIKENDTTKLRTVVVQFIGSDKFHNKDTAIVRIGVRPGINYPQKYQEHQKISQEMYNYVQNLKLTFYVVSKNVKSNKSTRATFDIAGSTTALAGTVVSTTATNPDVADIGKILPSIGLTLVPVKEAVAPAKIQEQNTAAQLRGITKRLEYLLSENALIGDRDPDVLTKTNKLRSELKTAQLQLIDLPTVEFEPGVNQAEADKYFNDPKVIKKYKLKVN
ncbi:MAG TPA: hypothetical protein VK166_18455 [Chitinophagaceae bacterium]|nr:hypothetical protein [Chitinophagaceae bacterium]